MPAFLTRLALALLASTALALAKNPYPVPTLNDLIKPWIFVRASEASTLFIDENFKDREPYGHLVLFGKDSHLWLEYDGTRTQLWRVTKEIRDEKQLTLTLRPFENPEAKLSKLLIYPYWDIDHCLVMIRFDPEAEENPVRFSTPYEFKTTLPYLAPEGE